MAFFLFPDSARYVGDHCVNVRLTDRVRRQGRVDRVRVLVEMCCRPSKTLGFEIRVYTGEVWVEAYR